MIQYSFKISLVGWQSTRLTLRWCARYLRYCKIEEYIDEVNYNSMGIKLLI